MNIVVTGASRGIGQIIANNLPASKMFLLYHADHDGMKRTIAGMKCDFLTLKYDISSENQVKDAFDKIEHVDVLINNAGIVSDSLIKNMSEEQWVRVMDVNLKGAFLCTKYVLPKMVEGSHIINISSITGHTGIIGASNYTASKGGLEAFTRSAARELIREGIYVNCLSLGFFEIGLGMGLSEKVREATMKQIPIHRFGDPMEIVRAIELIINSRYMVGATINISGGFYL